MCGGIGPTPDDRTFEAVARALDRPLEENAVALATITAMVARMHAAGWIPHDVVSEGNRRCAMVPAGGLVLLNRRGMAPPMAYEVGDDRWLFILPGVPREFTTIVEEELIPRFFAAGTAARVVEVRYRGVPEAELYTPMRQLAAEFDDVAAGSYPQTEARQVIVRLRGLDRSASRRRRNGCWSWTRGVSWSRRRHRAAKKKRRARTLLFLDRARRSRSAGLLQVAGARPLGAFDHLEGHQLALFEAVEVDSGELSAVEKRLRAIVTADEAESAVGADHLDTASGHLWSSRTRADIEHQ